MVNPLLIICTFLLALVLLALIALIVLSATGVTKGPTGATGAMGVTGPFDQGPIGPTGPQSLIGGLPVGSTPNDDAFIFTGGNLQLQPASASFPGVVDTDFQTFAGTKQFSQVLATTMISAQSNDSTTGFIRMANTDVIGFRNAGNTRDLALGVSSTNQLLFDGSRVAPFLPSVMTTITGPAASTYSIPTGTLFMRVVLVGGGGGGAGSSATADMDAGPGGNGGASTLTDGTNTLTAGNGGGSAANLQTLGGLGGTCSVVGSDWQTTEYNGNVGQGTNQSGAFTVSGGMYGAPLYGSAGVGGMGASVADNGTNGAGGGSGGMIEAILPTWHGSTLTYNVGARGTNGTAGTSGFQSTVEASPGILVIQAFFN